MVFLKFLKFKVLQTICRWFYHISKKNAMISTKIKHLKTRPANRYRRNNASFWARKKVFFFFFQCGTFSAGWFANFFEKSGRTFSECAKLIDFEENRSFLIVSNHNGQEIVSIQEGEDGVEPVIVQSEVPATKYQQHVVSNHCVQ